MNFVLLSLILLFANYFIVRQQNGNESKDFLVTKRKLFQTKKEENNDIVPNDGFHKNINCNNDKEREKYVETKKRL